MDWPMLETLGEEERRLLLGSTRRRRFARSEVVFHEGDLADSMHLLARGRVSIRVTTPSADGATLAILGPGATFGELALVGSMPRRAATVTAMEPSETLSIRRDQFEALRLASPGVDRFLVGLLAAEVRRLDALLLEALFVPAETRVLRRLVTLADVYGGGAAGTVIPLTQEVLGSMAGTTRPTTNQVLRSAEEAGIISIGRAKIEILDPGALARRSR